MKEERIQKIIAESGVCSRRAAEAMIEAGRVKLNGRPVKLGDKMDPAKDLISIDGQTLAIDKKKEYLYIMLHKPRGYVTTAKDELGRKTVMELLKDVPQRVYPVGRLDKDSEGLLLFTNDGDFANLVSHPSHGVSKLYRVTLAGTGHEEALAALAGGVTLDDGSVTQQASVRVITEEESRTVVEITIKEGKNRQIRRMCEAVNLQVMRLKRNALGPLRLGMLAPGKYRSLEDKEVAALRASAGKSARSAKQGGRGRR